MKLILSRRYRPKRTLGHLSCMGKAICRTIEAPRAMYNPRESCLPEGKYILNLIHTEEQGWIVGVGNEGEGKIMPLISDSALKQGGIYPLTCWRADGTPLFLKLAHLRLMEKLSRAWEMGEEIELEIVCEPVPYRLQRCSVPAIC